MSTLSRCSTRPEPASSPSGPGFFLVAAFAAVAISFGLGQLHLKFAVSDLRRETNRLQDKKMDLRSRINKMRGEVESLKSGERLMAYAESELGMVRMSQAQVEKVQVTEFVKARYLGTEIASDDTPEAGAPEMKASRRAAGFDLASPAHAGE